MKQTFTFSNREEFLKAIDDVLPESYTQSRDLGAGKVHQYYATAIQEAVADNVLHYWHVTDEQYTLIANEIVCTVRITYMPSYPDAEEYMCTGSAATPIQMDSGANITDFPAKKKTNALEYNLPSVKSKAIGNALAGLGNIFGRNLSRKINKNQSVPKNFTLRSHGKTEINTTPEPTEQSKPTEQPEPNTTVDKPAPQPTKPIIKPPF